MPLSAAAVRNAKGAEKPYKLSDGGGLFLLVSPNGRRYWRMAYRFARKQKTLAFGVFPDVSLADARERRDQARRLLAKGIDPAQQARLDKIAASLAAAGTFGAIADEWLERSEEDGLSEVTLKKNRWLIDQVRPFLGRRPIADINAPELLLALRKIEARERYDTARRLRGLCGQVFRYAIATARAERDVSADLRGALVAHKATYRAAVREPKDVEAHRISDFDQIERFEQLSRLEPDMRTVTANQAKTRFGELIDRVQREPVRVMRHNRIVGVMVSAEDYAAMRACYTDRLAHSLRKAAGEAEVEGLTKSELGQLVSHGQ
ncbi:MAG: type II toxin-antitoxin system prevent-host-death family antitoxin [Novosphingobium sp.]